MAKEQVGVPDIGGAEGAEVIELLVAVGDTVEVDQGLIVLESDKASMEIPSTVAGTVAELLVDEGDQIAEGAPIVVIETQGDDEAGDDKEEEKEKEKEKEDAEDKGSGDDKDDDGEESSSQEESADRKSSSESETEISGNDDGTDPSAEDSEKARRKSDDSDKPSATDDEAADTEADEAKAQQKSSVAQSSPDSGGEADDASTYAGPAVRKLAREFGVPLSRVSGSGPQGRVLKEDLHGYVQEVMQEEKPGGSALPTVPDVDFSRFGEVEVVERSKLDRLTADNMRRSWLNVPHVTQHDEADITELEEFRKSLRDEAESRDVKLSPLPFILKACALALRDNPRMNSSSARDGQDLVQKDYVHIGMAVDTPVGLMVPVIRDVDRKSVWDIAQEVMSLAAAARERKLKPAQMQGGCFTVSSLGAIGGTGFTPIVNSPEVGILGVSRATVKPVWDGAAFQSRTMLPLSLSYDHRVVNGGDAGRFSTQVVGLLSDIRRLVM